ncbi:tRNA (adenosine(37)-N6)-threonylcarbamoyltransferase complex dimerization subunit type 1 TsaB, partial [Micromonospora phytophila]|nr:tRNA (adenosine(37)-N6)-threonylcarbamoyltransferase complex dimerization subunit type 1 TsaB [Micromonospora phytophila]
DLPVRAEPRYPDARVLAALAAERIRAGAPGEALTPLYLRRPDAVAATARKPVLPGTP